jgi:hypothetical protein
VFDSANKACTSPSTGKRLGTAFHVPRIPVEFLPFASRLVRKQLCTTSRLAGTSGSACAEAENMQDRCTRMFCIWQGALCFRDVSLGPGTCRRVDTESCSAAQLSFIGVYAITMHLGPCTQTCEELWGALMIEWLYRSQIQHV